MRSVTGVDELRCDADPPTGPPHAAFEDRADVERLPDSADVLVLVSECERRGTRNDAQAWHAGQRVEDLLGETVAEVLVFLVRAEVGERQDRDRGLELSRLDRAPLERRPHLAHRL